MSGETGLASGQPRSATVEVIRNATLSTRNKLKFDVTFKKDAHAAVKVYKNILVAVCSGLREANNRVTEMET